MKLRDSLGRFIKTRKDRFCIDCNKPITIYSKSGLCKSCAFKGNRHPQFGHRKPKVIYYCINNCGRKVAGKNRRCKHCANTGSLSGVYKGGKPKCIDCGKIISYGRRRCKCCAMKKVYNRPEKKLEMSIIMKKRWSNKIYRYRNIKNLFKSLHLKPNKPEKTLSNLLDIILPKEYEYVGDGKIIIDCFNPDFINCNGQKKIIELYGDYWHNLSNYKKRDIRRLHSYKKYGYETLIIWEHELNDLDNIKEKLIKFNKEN